MLSLSFAGRTRTALVHVPRGIPARRHVPLVLVLHGAGSSGPRMERYSGFSQTADQGGFVAVYPSSVGSLWNYTAAPGGVDDAGFLGALISHLEHTMCVDSRRVYATGVSNGAGMAALAACRLGALRAVAPVEGLYAGQPRCRPSHPVSMLEIHGTADRIAPYYGPGGRASSDGMPPFVNAWVRIDGCAPQAISSAIAARTVLYRFTSCNDAVTVEHIRIEGGEHQWPGALPPDPGPPATICGSCAIWSFFSALPAGGSGSGGSGLLG
jgi:polyhydroxybutyrate depolymerase